MIRFVAAALWISCSFFCQTCKDTITTYCSYRAHQQEVYGRGFTHYGNTFHWSSPIGIPREDLNGSVCNSFSISSGLACSNKLSITQRRVNNTMKEKECFQDDVMPDKLLHKRQWAEWGWCLGQLRKIVMKAYSFVVWTLSILHVQFVMRVISSKNWVTQEKLPWIHF